MMPASSGDQAMKVILLLYKGKKNTLVTRYLRFHGTTDKLASKKQRLSMF